MVNFIGVIIEESLEDASILKKMKIIKQEIEKVTPEHSTPHLKIWTLDTIEIDEPKMGTFAKQISGLLDSTHCHWYADFKNKDWHYVIFKNKFFKVDRSKPEQYKQVVKYGLSLGIPDYQLVFSSDIDDWKR